MRAITYEEVSAVDGGVIDWMAALGGLAIGAAAIFAVAVTAPVSIPILSVAGGSALVAEGAGAAMMDLGMAGY